MRFNDRVQAGRLLAQRLGHLGPDVVVLGLPRGGMPVAAEVAAALRAPLDVIVVRKLGVPHQPEFAMGAIGEGGVVVLNDDVLNAAGVTRDELAVVERAERAELERRIVRFRGGRSRVDLTGKVALLVDDGIATGATARAACKVARALGARRVVLATPVAPADTVRELGDAADEVVCLVTPEHFRAVGQWYRDFTQTPDEVVVALLAASDDAGLPPVISGSAFATSFEADDDVTVCVNDIELGGHLSVPRDAVGVVLFAHGSGSSRHSPRNRFVAAELNAAGLATVLVDLLTPTEELDRSNVFDIDLLANRLLATTRWLTTRRSIGGLPVGYFGASTGAGAALWAAADAGPAISAIVSRGGRPDLAGDRLAHVTAPTLLIVGSDDPEVAKLNREALAAMTCEASLTVVPGASHLFEEPGTLQVAAVAARDWFVEHLHAPRPPAPPVPRTSILVNPPGRSRVHGLAELVRESAEPFASIDHADLGPLLERIGDSTVVLLGEASHGTSEFYRLRERITRQLIVHHGFEVVAVEADWPDAATIDRFVCGRTERPTSWEAFSRFPTWMWRNREVAEFVAWLRQHNAELESAGLHSPKRQVRFCGLDMYSLFASRAEVLTYLEQIDPEAAEVARRRYSCLSPWQEHPEEYGRAVTTGRFAGCEEGVIATLSDLLRRRLEYAVDHGDDYLDATQNALVVANAERYYRAMYADSRASWNLRDQHMFETLQHVRAAHGPRAKVVVWEHNSHVGDASATAMGARGEHNVGMLCRRAYGDDSFLVGFGTDHGTVAAATDWGGPMEVKAVRPSHPDSYERTCHDSGVPAFFLHLREPRLAELRPELSEPRLERAIGVIYRPETEMQSHYFAACLPEQFDEYIWIDETRAIHPTASHPAAGGLETFPSGL